MQILERPYSLAELRTLSRDGSQRLKGIIAFPWEELLGYDVATFGAEASRRVTGSRYGLDDLAIRLAGCLNDSLLLEVSGDVAPLLANYAAYMAQDQREREGQTP